MPFDYYRRLAPRQRAVYRRSDELTAVPLAAPAGLRPWVERLRDDLEAENRRGLTAACQGLCDAITAELAIAPVAVRVLPARPRRDWGELHGLYEPADDGPARLTVWMRTAQRRQVVAFKTFLRTLVHELCHHLDYEHFDLPDSFHTEGFFRRESDLQRQLLSG